jgi:7-carboxy-7-deazaguanine synthase
MRQLHTEKDGITYIDDIPFNEVKWYYMAPVPDRAALQEPPEGTEFAMCNDMSKRTTHPGSFFVWIYQNGKWSDISIEIVRNIPDFMSYNAGECPCGIKRHTGMIAGPAVHNTGPRGTFGGLIHIDDAWACGQDQMCKENVDNTRTKEPQMTMPSDEELELNEPEKRLRISEAFYSIEGEGPLTGVPTVFIRTFGCNFTCSGFSNPTGQKVIPIKIDTLQKFKSTVGCDSIYSWHPDYKDLSQWHTISQLASHVVEGLLPGGKVLNPRTGQSPILSLTGGEPTMHQDAIIQLINHPMMQDFDKLLIETNAAFPLKDEFIEGLNVWKEKGRERLIIWACSPKLSISGEPRHKAIRPEIIAAQMQVRDSLHYLKFVSDGSTESFEEIVDTVKEYNDYLSNFMMELDPHSIYVMPMGATHEQQMEIQRKVADKCLEYGYSFCIRAHCFVYNNEVGT